MWGTEGRETEGETESKRKRKRSGDPPKDLSRLEKHRQGVCERDRDRVRDRETETQR